MIFDTNILIYLSKFTLNPDLIFTQNSKSAISVITKIEALGFHFTKHEELDLLLSLINELTVIPLSDAIAEETIKIRTTYKIKLTDAIIYATALTENLPLMTNNIADFKNLGDKVKIIDPFTL